MTASPAGAKLASPPASGERRAHAQDALIYAAALLYAALVAITITRHEPWADEAQAWLLGRDASLFDLWTRLMHYEGSPGLWQTLLHILVHLGLPYGAYNFLSGGLGLAAAWLFLRYAPLPLAVRLLVPFTYFLAYQYAVVARSYSLLGPLLFAVAAIYQDARKRPALVTTLLCLMAGVSVHGFFLSGCIGLAIWSPALAEWRKLPAWLRRRWLIAAGIYAAVMFLFLLSAWPAHDVAFAEERGIASIAVNRFEDVLLATAGQAFTGEWITSFVAVGLTIPFLWRGGGALIFFPATALFWIFGVVVYSKEWHYGIVFLIWVFALWISANRLKIPRMALVGLGGAIAVQCYWTATAVAYDLRNPYSGSLEAVRYFKAHPAKNLYAIGYPAIALQPYFASNIYSDINDGSAVAYWDWSKRNPANPEQDAASIFSARRRDFVLVSYGRDYYRHYWGRMLARIGYVHLRHFEGSTFWHDSVLEPEAYDLYKRMPAPPLDNIASSLQLGAACSEDQLLTGFYSTEQNAWRWTAKQFSVVLRMPPDAASNGAEVSFQFYLPEIQVAKLGPFTLSGNVDGYPLAARTYARAGRYVYTAAVPREALKSGLVTVNLHFNKSAVGINGDRRDLAVVASAIGLK
ncbi:MAG TPA: hypothetical protein VKV17_07125 [Bryobacteraceae bacterium]|nr:hypothetical protein [Bryobacteraceae bacterium]